jgi:hypothetical protein
MKGFYILLGKYLHQNWIFEMKKNNCSPGGYGVKWPDQVFPPRDPDQPPEADPGGKAGYQDSRRNDKIPPCILSFWRRKAWLFFSLFSAIGAARLPGLAANAVFLLERS